MPIPEMFRQRLFWQLPRITAEFGTPFHIYDEALIRWNARHLNRLFGAVSDFQEFFAVKACPNLRIMGILHDEGFGFDCSSGPELSMSLMVGARGEHIMFTSNNTTPGEFREAADTGGCILNLDDITFVAKVPEPFPDLICFRYNPGERRTGNSFIGKPVEAKYGVTHDQFLEAYRLARLRGATRFGVHTMVASNERDYKYMVETVRMLLGLCGELEHHLGIDVEFINMGGGIGIPYHPTDHQPFDLEALAHETGELLEDFKRDHGYKPKLFMESGRAITGPFGVLVTEVVHRLSKYREYVGVDACMSSLMRPAMYGAYHHINVVGSDGKERLEKPEVVDVVGALCENNDKFAVQRELPSTLPGDFLVINDAGAHGIAMGFQYNGRLRPAELFLREDGTVELIRRRETTDDYLRTQQDFNPRILEIN